MSKPSLGVRHICFQCGAKFYDLSKPEIVCPKCGANQADAPRIEEGLATSVKPSKAVVPVDVELDSQVDEETKELLEFTDEEIHLEDGEAHEEEEMDGFDVKKGGEDEEEEPEE